MENKQSIAAQDYLKAIFKLSEKKAIVSTKSVAERMEISDASVSAMFQKLAQQEMVIYQAYRGVQLTEKGKKNAILTIRRHRILELFLTNVLGLGWDEVDSEAEILEHVVSDRIIEAMTHHLGDIRFDPHGSPIPDKDGHFSEIPSLSLPEAQPFRPLTLKRICDSDDQTLRYLSEKGIHLNITFSITEYAPQQGPITLQLPSGSCTIAYNICQSMRVIYCDQPSGQSLASL